VRRGVVVLRVGASMTYLTATVVARLVPLPPLGAVPNAPPDLAGLAHADGEVIPVVDLRPASDRTRPLGGMLVVCSYLGEPLGLAGAQVVGVGHYDTDPSAADLLIVGTERARPLDLAPLTMRLQAHGWGRVA
jgi:chemotaxis signal transduction protein